MLVVPAIDILGGVCVRLRGGDYSAATQYSDKPLAVAEEFLRAGAKRIHIVDLDAAKVGAPVNAGIVSKIAAACAAAGAQAQVGGGLRNEEAVAKTLAAGAAFAILGTAAVANAPLRQKLIARHPGQIIVGADSRAGVLAFDGWLQSAGVAIDDFFNELRPQPPAAIVHTDISKDGMLAGVDAAANAAAAARAPCPLFASGGVGGLQDIRALAAAGGVAGVVVGKALYSGAFSLPEALAVAQEAAPAAAAATAKP